VEPWRNAGARPPGSRAGRSPAGRRGRSERMPRSGPPSARRGPRSRTSAATPKGPSARVGRRSSSPPSTREAPPRRSRSATECP
jgi:hypothetical protein